MKVRTTERSDAGLALTPREGYERVAGDYKTWRWSRFWRENERPIVRGWLAGLSKGRGLDAGSGLSPYHCDILELGHSYVALDISHRMLVEPRCAPGTRDTFWRVEGDVRRLPFTSHCFEWLLCTRVLTHVAQLEPLLNQFSAMLQPGSELLITDLHAQHPYDVMRVQTSAGEIPIETHKHTCDHIVRTIEDTRLLRVIELREYRLDDLPWSPTRTDFSKLYATREAPIFYSLRCVASAARGPEIRD